MKLRIAFRSVWRDKTFAIMTLILLSLGVGACTAIFTIVDTVLLRPLPYHQPDRIVTVWSQYPKTGRVGPVSHPDLQDWSRQSHSFAALSEYSTETTNIFSANVADRTEVALVGPGFLEAMGTPAVAGRGFATDELAVPGKRVALINHDLAQRRFGDDRHALGQNIRFYNQSYEIIGVLPSWFRFPGESEVWAPVAEFIGTQSRTAHNFQAVGRLRDGISPQAADLELKTVAARLAIQYPEDANKSTSIIPLQTYLVQDVEQTLRVLLASVLLLLMIACANVANLMLARTMGRRREMAVRLALGATRWQLTRQLLTESLALALPAGATGLLFGYLGALTASHLAPSIVPGADSLTLDWRVAAFAFAVAMLSSVIFTVMPALQAGSSTVADALHQGGSPSVVSGPAKRFRAALVVGELAGSLSLLVAAFLLLRSLSALLGTDPGYKGEGVLVSRMSVPVSNSEDAARATAFFANLLERTRALPDVQEVSATNALPNTVSSNGQYQLEGRIDPQRGDFVSQRAGFIVTAPGYFRVLQVSAKSGRDFDQRDDQDHELTCIINSALARESFPNEDPIGHRIRTGMDGSGFMRIVGVVGDVRQYGPDREPRPIIYMPFRQHPRFSTALDLLVRPRTSGDSVTSSIRRAANSLDPELAVEFLPLVSTADTAVAVPRFRTILFSLFAGMALLLAAAGLYGVMAYTVVQRRREMGVRMALGAARSDIFRLVMREGARLIVVGLAIGIPLAVLTSRIISGLVFGIAPTDPLTFVASALVLGLVGVSAAYLPAYRATRVELSEVLRQE
jgi:putative ABC transport system permease protein